MPRRMGRGKSLQLPGYHNDVKAILTPQSHEAADAAAE